MEFTFTPILNIPDGIALRRVFEALNPMELPYELKDRIYRSLENASDFQTTICELHAMQLDRDVLSVLLEQLIAF